MGDTGGTPEDGIGDSILNRRQLLKGAAATGATAFVTPIVVGVYSTAASAQGSNCDPALNSDAVDLLQGSPESWNVNCDRNNTFAGRWNAQGVAATLAGSGGSASILFGQQGVDNLPVECSYYTLDAPPGWVCTVQFEVQHPNGTPGCPDGVEGLSTPGDCDALSEPTYPDFTPPANALPVPYCYVPGGAPNECDSNARLVLVAWSCCPT